MSGAPGGNGAYPYAGDWDPDDFAPVATPPHNASFRQEDDWLRARGWTEDRGAWVFRGRRVTIATHQEAVKIQRRRDKSALRGQVEGKEPKSDSGSEVPT